MPPSNRKKVAANRKVPARAKASPAAQVAKPVTKPKPVARSSAKTTGKAAEKRTKVAAKATPAKRAVKPSGAKKSVMSAAAKRRAGTPPDALARRAVFIDVENTSNEESLSRVIEGLKLDRGAQPTELYAFGNWRAVGSTMSRHLARLGATLVHTSPVTGVKDWSDLWIAVAAGRWIALASPGDILEIISNDKAFEAVGDAAAGAGVIFRRVLHRHATTAAAAAAAADASDEDRPRRRRRRGGRGRRGGSGVAASSSTPLPRAAQASRAPRAEAAPRPSPARHETIRHEPAPRLEPAPRHELVPRSEAAPRRDPPARRESTAAAHDARGDAHGATQEQILATIRRLTGGDTARWVNLDVIANALKDEGFTRPPGSIRLVVRLRRMKDVEVQSNGMVRLAG